MFHEIYWVLTCFCLCLNIHAYLSFRRLGNPGSYSIWQDFLFICWLCGLILQDKWWETMSWNSLSSHLATVLQQLGMTQWVTPLSSWDADCPAVCYPSSWRLDRQGHSLASVDLRHDPACMSLWLSRCCAGPHSWHLDAKDHVISQQED